MILTCPECKSRYVVNPNALLPRGRTVRCAKCRHSWFEDKPDDDVEVVPTAPQAEATDPQPDEPGESQNDDAGPVDGETSTPSSEADQDDTTDTEGGSGDNFDFPINKPRKRKRPVPKGSNLPALQNQKYGNGKVGWASLLIFITAIISSILIFEETIKESWPATAKLYRAIGLDNAGTTAAPQLPISVPIDERLKIGGLAPRLEQINNISHLIIAGYVENISDEIQTIPPLKVVLKDANGGEVRNWSFTPEKTTVNPESRIEFETALPNPPAEARDISVILTDD